MIAVAIGSSAEAGSSISSTSGRVAMARAMQSRCCWPPERPVPGSCSRSLTSFQRPARFSEPLHQRLELGLVAGHAVDARAVGDVLEDRLRERVGLLEHHADAGAQLDHVDARVVDVHAVELDRAGDPRDRDGVVHPVDAAQEGRLAAARRADQRGHLVRAGCRGRRRRAPACRRRRRETSRAATLARAAAACGRRRRQASTSGSAMMVIVRVLSQALPGPLEPLAQEDRDRVHH